MNQKKTTYRKSESLVSVFPQFAGAPLPSLKEAEAIVAKVKAGEQGAEEELKNTHIRFIASVAKQYINQGLTVDELIEAGAKGLVLASKQYDSTRGTKWISYAVMWIRQSILVSLKEKNKKIIEEIIKKAFKRVKQAYDYSSSKKEEEDSILIFPKYRKKENDEKEKIRVSEQELRFGFVEEFIKDVEENHRKWHYAVEVPTEDLYIFKDKSNPTLAEDGQSAMFDLVIYNDGLDPIALLEFKAKNPDKSKYEKDFIKLENLKEGNHEVLRYFLEIVENSDNGTKTNIEKDKLGKRKYTHFMCYDITHDKIILDLS